jgi:hypothetical protein
MAVSIQTITQSSLPAGPQGVQGPQGPAGASSTPGGNNTELQYNNNGVFAGASGLTTTGTELNIASGIKTLNTSPAINVSQTWDNSGNTFTAIRLNVTDTASATGSLLFDGRVDNASVFTVDKSGGVYSLLGAILGNNKWSLAQARFAGNASYYIGWASTSTVSNSTTPDTRLYRDEAYTIAQRNATNPQSFRVYKTFTDADNYERGFLRWNGNIFEVGDEGAGSGVSRQLRLVAANVSFSTNIEGGNSRTNPNLINSAFAITNTGAFNASNMIGLVSRGESAYNAVGVIGYAANSSTWTYNTTGLMGVAVRNSTRSAVGVYGAIQSTNILPDYEHYSLSAAIFDNGGITGANIIEGRSSGTSRFLVSGVGAVTANNGAITASTPALNLLQEWNNSGVAFTGLKFNAIDTASASGSLLLDVQLGGTSRFKVSRTGGIATGNPSGYNLDLGFTNNNYITGFYQTSNRGSIEFGAGAGTDLVCRAGASGGGTGTFKITAYGGVTEVVNDGNPQIFRIYNTWTNSSDQFERGHIRWNSNVLQIGTEKGSVSGTARPLELQTDGITRATIEAAGTFRTNTQPVYVNATYNTGISSSADGYVLSISTRYGTHIDTSLGRINLYSIVKFGAANYSPGITVAPYATGLSTGDPIYGGLLNASSSTSSLWLYGKYGGTYAASTGYHNGTGISIWCGFGAQPTDANANGGNAGNFDVWLNAGGAGTGTGVSGNRGKLRVLNDSTDLEVFSVNQLGNVVITSAITGDNGTLTSSSPILDLSQTWNDAGTAFVGLRFNVVRTAYGASSRLLSLTADSGDRFFVTSTGEATLLGTLTAGAFTTTGTVTAGTVLVTGSSNYVALNGSSFLQLSDGTYPARMQADGNGYNVSLRNGTNPHSFLVYNTFVNSTNYERGFLKWDSNTFKIGTEKGSGGGTSRALELQTDGVTRAVFSTAPSGTIPIARFTGNSGAHISIENTSATSSGNGAFCFLVSNPPSGAMANGDRIGGFVFAGNSATGVSRNSALIAAFATQAWNDTTPQAGAELRFETTNNGTITRTVKLTLGSAATFADAVNIAVGTSTGTKIATATSQKLGFWNATPVVQPTTAVTGAERVAGGGATVTATDTFDGYTIAQVVAALRSAGLLA